MSEDDSQPGSSPSPSKADYRFRGSLYDGPSYSLMDDNIEIY